MNGLIRFSGCVSFLTLVILVNTLHAAPSTNVVVEVIDGDTIKIRHQDDGAGKAGKEAIHCLRGAAAPHLDQPFGKQSRDRLKELAVAGKEITHSGPVGRPYKKLSAVRFRTEKGNLAVMMVSEGLAWVIESELEDKHAKPGSSKKLIDEADALLKAREEARKAKRGLWADKDSMPPWVWRDKAKEIKNSVGMKFVHIPPGKFTMGSPESEVGREAQETQHEVKLTRGFYMGAYEVTVGHFKQFVADTKYQTDGERDGKGAYGANEAGQIEEMHAKFTWKNPGFEQTDDHPVVDVSWQDAKAFCKWLSEKEKKTYRLPTEAEWEYACRAGTKTAYVHGDDLEALAAVGNGADATARAKYPSWSIGIKAKDGHIFTAPTGQFKANAFGLHDMHGNVWEWCEDWYDPQGYATAQQTDPTGPAEGKARVQRGGGWSSDAKRCRSAARIGRAPSTYRGCYLGFRVVLEQADAATVVRDANPRIVIASDAKLQKEFEYLVYDLGKGIELKLVKVPAKGKTFMIGSSKQEQDAVVEKYFAGKRPDWMEFENDHVVALTDDYFIGQFEVTRGQFRRFLEATGYKTETEQTDGGYGWNEELKKFEGRDKKYSWMNTGAPGQSDAHPVTNISRADSRKFCEWLAQKADGEVRLREVRLPGEVEWEFACRAGSTGRFCFGDDDEKLAEFANIADATWNEKFPNPKAIKARDGHVFAAAVGQFRPNEFGLYDMHGNVWEWCEDFYGKYAALPKLRNGIQTKDQGQLRPVMRGGACYANPSDNRCAFRWLVGAGASRYGNGGFRVVCMP